MCVCGGGGGVGLVLPWSCDIALCNITSFATIWLMKIEPIALEFIFISDFMYMYVCL